MAFLPWVYATPSRLSSVSGKGENKKYMGSAYVFYSYVPMHWRPVVAMSGKVYSHTTMDIWSSQCVEMAFRSGMAEEDLPLE